MPLTRQICITVPTPEGLEADILRFHQGVIVAHPYATACVLLLWSFYPKAPFSLVYTCLYKFPRSVIRKILGCFGFGGDGVQANSYAAVYQSRYYGGYTPQDSMFASFQSYGAIDVYEDQSDGESGSGGWFFRLLGWTCFVGAITVLIKYGI